VVRTTSFFASVGQLGKPRQLAGPGPTTPTHVISDWLHDAISIGRRLDAYAERMRAELPGARFARAEAVRVLLSRALDGVERSSPAADSLA
jgi:hypothetical protein